MTRKFKNRKTGELAYYKDGVFKQGRFCVEIGVEPSSEFWNQILFITEDGVEIFEGGVYYVPQRKDKKYDGFLSIIAVSGMSYNNETKRFASKQKTLDFIEDFNKEPLFTTEDNIPVFKGTSYVKLNNYSDWSIVTGFVAESSHENYQGLKFSTEEAAEEYTLMNKPLLSLNDLLSVWGSDVDIERYKESPLFKNFKDLASGKI